MGKTFWAIGKVLGESAQIEPETSQKSYDLLETFREECTDWTGNFTKTFWAIGELLGESAQIEPETSQKPYELLNNF